ncbi:hypothetical protein [Streptomyces sp. NPDC089915]|uniref:hypothetical protein n=1 Tax=Streptomyces sp. NPDC089915 TaxID=3155186 RepID=UPI00341645CB
MTIQHSRPRRREGVDLPADRGCLRWVLGAPLAVFLYLPAAWLCFVSFGLRPEGGPYDPVRDDARFTAQMCVALCFAGLLLTAVPLFHRTLGRWWYAAPFALASLAFLRVQTL